MNAAACLLAASGALPLVMGSPAALEDWPSHVARVTILLRMNAGDPFWPQFYEHNTLFLPNIGADIAIIALTHAGLSVPTAATCVLLLTYLLFVGGAWLLAKANDAADPFKIVLASVLFYNGALMDGFVNFALAIAMSLVALSIWTITHRPSQRAIVAVIASMIIFFCHLIAAVVFVFVIGLLELAAALNDLPPSPASVIRRASPLAAGVAILLLLIVSPTAGDHHESTRIWGFNYGDSATVVQFVKNKAMLFVHPFIDGIGLLGLAILAVGGLLVAGGLLHSVSFRRLSVKPQPAFIVLVGGMLCLILASPSGFGEGYGLDYRLPPVAAVLAMCFLRLEWRSLPASIVCFGLLAALSAARSGVLIDQEASNERVFRSFTAAAERIPEDSVVLSAIGTPRNAIPWSAFWDPPAEYMGTLATQAHVFVPSVFALRSQHSLIMREKYRDWFHQFDLSDAASVRTTDTAVDKLCKLWQNEGHRGSVYIAIIYPSSFSDTAYLPESALAMDSRFRLVNGCSAQKGIVDNASQNKHS